MGLAGGVLALLCAEGGDGQHPRQDDHRHKAYEHIGKEDALHRGKPVPHGRLFLHRVRPPPRGARAARHRQITSKRQLQYIKTRAV